MCFKCFKRKKNEKPKKYGNRINIINNKQIAQYIVVDLERMREEERKAKESNSDIFTKKKEDSISNDNSDIRTIPTKPNKVERVEFVYNFFEAPPPNSRPDNVLNDEKMLNEEEIILENL